MSSDQITVQNHSRIPESVEEFKFIVLQKNNE